MDEQKPDYQAGLDLLQEDMAEHQRRFRGEPTAEANRALAADAIQRLENERAENPIPPQTPRPPAPVETTLERKQVGDVSYMLKKERDTSLVRKANAHELWFLQHAEPRILLLLTKPESGPLGGASWRDQIIAVMSIQTHAASLRAAADNPTAFAAQKQSIEAMPALQRAEVLKAIGAQGVSDLTPAFALEKAAELDRRFMAELLKVLEASSAIFGDWKRDAPKKVQVG